MTNMEEVIKKKTEEMVKLMKNKYEEAGMPFTTRDELIYRGGISQGLMIAGLALVNTPANITLGDNK